MTARRALALIVLAAGIASALEGALSPAAGQERKDPRRSERPGKPRRSPAEPGRSALSPEASLLIQQAEQYRRLGQCDRAIPLLEELVARHPQIAVAPEMLSSCYLETGRPADAAGLLERMLAAEPERLAYIRDLGTAYLDLGRRADAIATWRRALDIGEENGPLYGVVAKLEQEAGLYDEAIATYREGSAHAAFLEQYSNEIVRLERVLGRPENALRELLRAMDRREASIDAELRTAVAIYRDAKSRDGLAALVDSAAAAGGGRAGAFRALRMAYLIEEGRAGEARAELLGAGAPEPSERELRAILMHVARARGSGENPGYGEFFAAVARRFLDRHPASPHAPEIMLMLAESVRESARRSTGAARAAALDDALSLAATARDHALGAPYRERASAIRAEILFEDLRRSDDALRELARIPERAFARSLGAKELRMRALLASADGDAAARALSGLAADPDSNAARIGEYGLAALAFRRGAYEASVKSFSDLAERHSASQWANDALEAALEIRAALPEGKAPLDLYRAAVVAAERGESAAAADSLAALERRHPESVLVPRAVFMRAEIEAAEGRAGEARADFGRVAERFPEHELAPRALERLASLVEIENAGEALEIYGSIMERYPEYPFMERVRERYVTLGASKGAAGGKGSK